MSNKKLSLLEKVGFGAGDMALNVVISSMMLIITFFYTDVYGLKTTDLALLFVLVKIVGACSVHATIMVFTGPATTALRMLKTARSSCSFIMREPIPKSSAIRCGTRTATHSSNRCDGTRTVCPCSGGHRPSKE